MLNKRNKPNPIISMDIIRHGEKNKLGHLTLKGKTQATISGLKLDPDKRLKMYTSSSERTRKTSEIIDSSFRGQKMGALRVKEELNENNSFPLVKNFIDKIKNLTGNERFPTKLAKMWLNKKIPRSIIITPQEVADKVIKKRIGVVVRYLRTAEKKGVLDQIKNTHVLTVTHAGIIMPLYERLTNKKYFDKYNRMPNGTEGIAINYYIKDEKLQIIMTFRKEQYDVTQKVYEILNKKN